MIRPTTILAIVILLGSAFGLFQVKYRVQDLNKDVAEMDRQIEEEKNAIHVLNAEWAYLNQPDRLRTLAEKYLQLSAVTIAQLKEPALAVAEVAVADAAPQAGDGLQRGRVARRPVASDASGRCACPAGDAPAPAGSSFPPTAAASRVGQWPLVCSHAYPQATLSSFCTASMSRRVRVASVRMHGASCIHPRRRARDAGSRRLARLHGGAKSVTLTTPSP